MGFCGLVTPTWVLLLLIILSGYFICCLVMSVPAKLSLLLPCIFSILSVGEKQEEEEAANC